MIKSVVYVKNLRRADLTCKEYTSCSDPVPDGSAPTDYPTVEDVTDDEDEPEAGPPPKRLCNPPPPGM